jgi:tetratricopeptide (TPR) repeat protein
LARTLALYPQFAYATFESAMVHVARREFPAAERFVRRRLDDPSTSANRFPGVGFHWLLGALEAEGGRHDEALTEFRRERSAVSEKRLYGPEYAAEAAVGAGFSLLALAAPERALVSFREAATLVPDYPRALVGEAVACQALGRSAEARRLWLQAEAIPAALSASGRPHLSRLVLGFVRAAQGRAAEAGDAFGALLDKLPPSYVGWMLPIDPMLAAGRSESILTPILIRLAERAR